MRACTCRDVTAAGLRQAVDNAQALVAAKEAERVAAAKAAAEQSTLIDALEMELASLKKQVNVLMCVCMFVRMCTYMNVYACGSGHCTDAFSGGMDAFIGGRDALLVGKLAGWPSADQNPWIRERVWACEHVGMWM